METISNRLVAAAEATERTGVRPSSVEARTDAAAQPALTEQHSFLGKPRSFLEKMARALVGIASIPFLIATTAFSILLPILTIGFTEIIKPGGTSVLLAPFNLTGRLADKIFKFSGLTDEAASDPTSVTDYGILQVEKLYIPYKNADGSWNAEKIVEQVQKDALRMDFSIQIGSGGPTKFNEFTLVDNADNKNFVFRLDGEIVATLPCTDNTLKLLSLCHQGALGKASEVLAEEGGTKVLAEEGDTKEWNPPPTPKWIPSHHYKQISIKCDTDARNFSIDITSFFSKHIVEKNTFAPNIEALKIRISPTQYRVARFPLLSPADIAASLAFNSRQRITKARLREAEAAAASCCC